MENMECNESCNERYSVFDIAWRVYCKKACSSDGESWDECKEDCKSLCHKAPVLKEYEWSAHLARSPGSPTQSRKCEKACIRGCAFKFNVTVAELVAALPKKPPPPPQKTAQTPPQFDIGAKGNASNESPDISA